ncbi:MAG: hypothetical protein GXO39_10020 [Thermotogae bacterium]|nr:hypothetical protein [Thermotogota bacterium]
MRKLFGVGIFAAIITGTAILLAQSDPQPQSATESLEAEMPQPQPQETPTEPTIQEETSQSETPASDEEKGGERKGLPEFKAGDYVYELPPKSLDNYYPPVARKAKTYPAYMDTLGRRFYDLVVDLNALFFNREDAEVSYFLFKDYYQFVADLVPDWKDMFLLDEVEQLGKELGFIKDSTDTTSQEQIEKDKKAIGKTEKVSEKAKALVKKIEYSCRACHITEIPRVYARYYWQTRDRRSNMATFMVRDPIKRKKMPYREFKRELQRDYYTILRSIDKGSRKQLRQSVRRFVKRFNYNQSLCSKCHDTDPYLFTTPTIGELVSDLDKEANKRVPSKAVLRRTLSSLYVQNCKGCHRVHVPTTYVQRWWYGQFDKPPEVPADQESEPVLNETPQQEGQQPIQEESEEQPKEEGETEGTQK